MSRPKKDVGITAEDLKKKMFLSLQSAGVLNNLKGYLRQSVINELRGRYSNTGGVAEDSESDLLAATMKRNREGTWNQKAVDNLVLYHLKQSHYLYSLSLFQQESGITDYDEALTEDLLLRLGASPDLLRGKSDKENQPIPSPHSSSTPVASGDDPKLLMWRILSRISSPQNLAEKIDESFLRQTQQDKRKPLSLADKLQAIDDEMDGTMRERRQGDIEHRKSIATLASATRRAEEAAEKRARESFDQWKKVELASMRVKEQEKAKDQITEKTRQLESDYAQRKEALLMREKSAIERLNNQKESLEKDLHHQRQLLLRELEEIRVREKSLQEREQMLRDTETLKLREIDLLKSETLGHGERTRRDSVVSSVAESLRKSLTGKESRQLDEVLRELNSRSGEAEMLRKELMGLKDELSETKAQLKNISRSDPRPSPRHRDISPRDPGDESLRKRLDDLTSQLNKWKEQDRVEKEATIQSEISRWRTEVSKLSEARDRLDEKQKQLDELTTRVGARLTTTTPRTGSRHVSNLPSSSLRILMDPQNDITRDPSIRDYDPVHIGRVRWADEMPYSVRPDLITSKKSPRSAHLSMSGNSTLDLDSSNDTSSSNDLSVSGLRKDIRQTFKDLEKESEHLEQMYKRYIQSNYKHVSPDIQIGRISPRQTRSSLREKSGDPAKTPAQNFLTKRDTKSDSTYDKPLAQRDHVISSGKSHKNPASTENNQPKITPRKDVGPQSDMKNQGERMNDSHGPLDLRSLDQRTNTPPPLDGDAGSSHSSTTSSQVSDVPVKELASKPITAKLDPPGDKKMLKEESHPTQDSISFEPSDLKPTPRKRQSALPPIGGERSSLPPISHQKEKLTAPSVSELLIGEKSPLYTRKPSPSKSDLFTEAQKYFGSVEKPEEDSESSFSSDFSLTGKKSPLESPEQLLNDGVKSPFERPALLEQKREELQRSLGQPELSLVERDASATVHEKSPDRDAKFKLDLEDNDDIQNILDSIDVRSARSIEQETDPQLADLLNQLEPLETVPSQSKPSGPQRKKPIVMPGEDLGSSTQSEDSVSLAKDVKKTADKETLGEPEKNDYTYSDEEFLSSTSSKTASEVKTMSDFEPSSTSIPRIEEKLLDPQQSDQDKSGDDVNWSNLQLDKSGEKPQSEPNQDSPRIDETHEKVAVDVFEDSQSEHSFEAPSSGEKKSQSSGDDFW